MKGLSLHRAGNMSFLQGNDTMEFFQTAFNRVCEYLISLASGEEVFVMLLSVTL